MAFCFGALAWNVATIGPSAATHAKSESEGIAGSWRCIKSNSPVEIHCLTREVAIGPKRIRATAPLKGIGTGLPAGTTQSSMTDDSSDTGAKSETM